MLNIPSEVVALLKADSVHKNFRVIFPSGEHADITNENLVAESVHFTESVMSQDKFKLGLCESPVIEFEAFGIENIKGKKIECYYEIYCASTVDDAVYREDLDAYVYPIPLGVFYVDSCKKEAQMNIRRVIAYGMQAYFEWKAGAECQFPCDLSNYIAIVLQTDELLANPIYLPLSASTSYNYIIRITYRYHISGSQYGNNTSNVFWHNIPDYVDHTFGSKFYDALNGRGFSFRLRTKTELIRFADRKMMIGLGGGNNPILRKNTSLNKKYSWLGFFEDFEPTMLQVFFDGTTYYNAVEGINIYSARTPNDKPVDINMPITDDYRAYIAQEEASYMGAKNIYEYSKRTQLSDIKFVVQKDYPLIDIGVINDAGTSYLEWHDITIKDLMSALNNAGGYTQARAELNTFWSSVNADMVQSSWLNGEDNRQTSERVNHNTIGITVNDNAQISREDMQGYVEDLLETQGRLGRFDREGVFETFTLDTDTLVPNDTDLVPSESLVPNGADVDTINPSEYETAWYDDELSLPYGACAANHKVSGTDTYTIVYADGYDADTDPSTYQIYDISNNDLVKEMTVEEITPILTTIITNLSNLRYMPSDIDMVGRPDIEAGDGIQVLTNSGAFNTYVLSRTIDGIQGLSDTITAK